VAADPMPELSSRWFTLPVSEALDHDYQARMTPAATSLAAMTGAVDASNLQPFIGDAQNAAHLLAVSSTGVGSRPDVYGNGLVDRLRIVGFPEFTAAVATAGNLNAIIPAEALNVAFAASGAKNQNVIIKVPAAESYGLPTDTVLGMLFEQDSGNQYKSRLKPEYRSRLDLMPFTSKNETHLRVITEVFYARAIDVQIGSSASWGAAAKVGTPLTGDGGAAPTPASPETPAERLTRLNSELNAATGGSAGVAGPGKAPGVAISVVAASDRGVTLRRVWERPIAIGIRGVFITIRPDGAVIASSPMTLNQPSK
jgi:hypothetical protein